MVLRLGPLDTGICGSWAVQFLKHTGGSTRCAAKNVFANLRRGGQGGEFRNWIYGVVGPQHRLFALVWVWIDFVTRRSAT